MIGIEFPTAMLALCYPALAIGHKPHHSIPFKCEKYISQLKVHEIDDAHKYNVNFILDVDWLRNKNNSQGLTKVT